jgi:uncharacterized protein with HEPN domain
MPREPAKYLFDIQQAADRIERFCAGKSFDDYTGDDLLKSAVERQLEIVGEALSQLGKHAPEVLRKIPDSGRIIGFRNILIHGYALVDDKIVWGVLETHLPPLRAVVEKLLGA